MTKNLAGVNKSPWLAQLNQGRTINELNQDTQTDVVVVGGGIAGIATAYFVLKMTGKKVAVVEANKIAHGATGHNAGQIVSYFEKQYFEIVKEYGQAMTLKAKDAVDQAWDLLDEMVAETKLAQTIFKFTDYTGYCDMEEILELFKENELNEKEGMPVERLWIASEAPFLNKIPKKYRNYYTVTTSKFIQDKLDTRNNRFWAVGGILGGCMNSALFVEEIAGFLLKKYPSRFQLFEHSPVGKVVLTKNTAHLMINNNLLVAQKVVLCTNGFTNLEIVNLNGENIDTTFHKSVRGVVGYMAGYKENSCKEPGAFSFFEGKGSKLTTPYFYLTRRPFSVQSEKYNLVCVGGPEIEINDFDKYDRKHPFSVVAQQQIDKFIRQNLDTDVKADIDYRFFWHGLMGYTKTGLRIIGPEPRNNVLMYNLGCNGVGILTSIFGGERIAQFILHKKLAPMIFDPSINSQE